MVICGIGNWDSETVGLIQVLRMFRLLELEVDIYIFRGYRMASYDVITWGPSYHLLRYLGVTSATVNCAFLCLQMNRTDCSDRADLRCTSAWSSGESSHSVRIFTQLRHHQQQNQRRGCLSTLQLGKSSCRSKVWPQEAW